MNNIKIVFFDIDGTLINYGAEHLTEKTLLALKKLKENNIKIVIATGRAPVSLPDFGDIEFDAYICFNGSLCFSGDNTIYSNCINKKDVLQIIYNATKMGKPTSLATRNKISANGIEKTLGEYFSIANLELAIDPDFDRCLDEDVYQLMYACTKDEYDKILENVENAKIAAWWDKAVDIIPKNGGKGQGIKKILEYFNINSSEAMAFGDGNNDIEMFKEVKNTVAMANASSLLKEHALYECKNVSEDGVYYFLTENNLI